MIFTPLGFITVLDPSARATILVPIRVNLF